MEPRTSTRKIDHQLAEIKLSLTINQLILKAQEKFPSIDSKYHIKMMATFLSLTDINILLDKLKEKSAVPLLNSLLSRLDDDNKVGEFRYILMMCIDSISNMDMYTFTESYWDLVHYNRCNKKMIELLFSSESHRSHINGISLALLSLKEHNLYIKKYSDLVLQFPAQAKDVAMAITANYRYTKPNENYKHPISEADFYDRLEKNFADKKSGADFICELHVFLRSQDDEYEKAKFCKPSCTIF